jgi:CRISPR-associated protein Cas1
MSIVVVEKSGTKLSLSNKRLIIDGDGIPLRLIETLILRASVAIESKWLLALAKEGIAVLFIDKNGGNMAMTLPSFAKNAEQKEAQYKALENRTGMAKYFLEEKIVRHAAHMRTTGAAVDVTSWRAKINEAESIESLMGIEGAFSRLYFKHYFSLFAPNLHKGKRSKRPPLDPVNAVLSYAYTLMYHLLTARLYAAGFEPSIGYLHTPFRSHYALASDFMELFRADINAAVAEWFDDGLLETKDFTAKNGVWLRYEGRKKLWKPLRAMMEDIEKRTDKEIARIRAAIA